LALTNYQQEEPISLNIERAAETTAGYKLGYAIDKQFLHRYRNMKTKYASALLTLQKIKNIKHFQRHQSIVEI
jgi:hypothetical protein